MAPPDGGLTSVATAGHTVQPPVTTDTTMTTTSTITLNNGTSIEISAQISAHELEQLRSATGSESDWAEQAARDLGMWAESVDPDGTTPFDATAADDRIALALLVNVNSRSIVGDLLDQYTVECDRDTGEWIGEPEFVGLVSRAAWAKRQDTDRAHYDTYEYPVADGHAETRAIEVVYADTAPLLQTCAHAFRDAGSIEQAAEIVTAGTASIEPEQLAGWYAWDAATDDNPQPTLAELQGHLDYLRAAGAEFDQVEAEDFAMRYTREA